jgi:hypothetical protein
LERVIVASQLQGWEGAVDDYLNQIATTARIARALLASDDNPVSLVFVVSTKCWAEEGCNVLFIGRHILMFVSVWRKICSNTGAELE